jgi:hypothetical protein
VRALITITAVVTLVMGIAPSAVTQFTQNTCLSPVAQGCDTATGR